jgi:hypothetical protein
MSALGHLQTWRGLAPMSVSPPTAFIVQTGDQFGLGAANGLSSLFKSAVDFLPKEAKVDRLGH